MKHLLLIFLVILTSCNLESKPNSEQVQSKQTELALQEANRQTGMPAIVNFQEKKIMKQIYELRDQENLICYAYLMNEYTGNIGQFLGKCIGYGIPYSTQFSNPEKYFDDPNGYAEAGSLVLPQAEPNGLFMPEGLSATWLLLLDEKGNPHPVYIEPSIIVSPFPLK